MGLINGSRWKTLRSLFESDFSRQIASRRAPHTNLEALSFVRHLGQDSAQEPGTPPSTVHAVTTFMKFPFFHTAEIIYGPLSAQLKEELWSIGQTRLTLLRHVLKGGIHRHQASEWIAYGASKELASFQGTWRRFNQDIYDSSAPETPIVSAWKSTIDGHVPESNVGHQKMYSPLYADPSRGSSYP